MIAAALSLFAICVAITLAADTNDFSYYQDRGQYEVSRLTLSRGFEHYSWMWYPTEPKENVHCFVFCMGTTGIPEDYASTGEHLASHGFAAIYVPMRPWDVTNGLEYCRNGTIIEDVPELGPYMDGSKLAVGGHSGGGPYAVRAASGVSDVAAIVTQHAASIPVLNRQSNATMDDLRGDMLVLCGTNDHVPFCGCSFGIDDYYNRAPLGRVLAQVPDDHITGACFEHGEENEAGYITAMLYYALRGMSEAADAMSAGKEGDVVTVDLQHVAEAAAVPLDA